MARIRVLLDTKVGRRLAGLSLQDSLRNHLHEEKQMTAQGIPYAGASSAGLIWDAIDWQLIEQHVRRLQMRIAKATADLSGCCCRVFYWAFERLEPYAVKIARTVLRGAKVSNGFGLPDNSLRSCSSHRKISR